MTVVLGISNSHNGSVALIRDGRVLSAIQAERLSRNKREALIIGKNTKLLRDCINYCLEVGKVDQSEINSVGISTPWRAIEINDDDLFEFIGACPNNYLGTFYVPHHLAHSEYIVHYGDNDPGLVLVIDGSGTMEEDRKLFNVKEKLHTNFLDLTSLSGKEVVSAYYFDGTDNHLIYRFSPSYLKANSKEEPYSGFLPSIGHLWALASLYCCGSRNEAGKVMGLAAFGTAASNKKKKLISLGDLGEIKINYSNFKEKFATPNQFGLDLTGSGHYENLAAQVQLETETTVLDLINYLKKKCPAENLYLSGGVALNVLMNETIIRNSKFKRVFLNGSVEDNGCAIGAALSVSNELGQVRKSSKVTDYYGKDYSDREILGSLKKFDVVFKKLSKNELYSETARLLCSGSILGWFQGRSEFGPRALGNRSILSDPYNVETKFMLDQFMKSRDRYRPYAPIVLEEDAQKYFDITGSSPVMMRNVKVLSNNLASATHVDNTARVQTVNVKQNASLYKLLIQFKGLTGRSVLLNTSFNLPGEPIVETPFDALSSFMGGYLDCLIMGSFLISRSAR